MYGSGNTITLPKEQYLLVSSGDAQQYYEYGERNSYRMQAYHRLDFGKFVAKTVGNVHGLFLFIMYIIDVIHFIYFEDFIDNNVEYVEAKQVSLFPIIPTVRYGLNFKMKRLSILLFTFLFIASCEESLNVKIPVENSKLSVTSYLHADDYFDGQNSSVYVSIQFQHWDLLIAMFILTVFLL